MTAAGAARGGDWRGLILPGLATLVALAILVSLGAWQLRRLEWKEGLIGRMEARAHADPLRKPVSVYEVHLESWLRGPFNEWLTYRDLAEKLVPYAVHMGFTDLELLPNGRIHMLSIGIRVIMVMRVGKMANGNFVKKDCIPKSHRCLRNEL